MDALRAKILFGPVAQDDVNVSDVLPVMMSSVLEDEVVFCHDLRGVRKQAESASDLEDAVSNSSKPTATCVGLERLGAVMLLVLSYTTEAGEPTKSAAVLADSPL
ncbi:hypothetical protein GQ600_13559 [Phytophthora cactorum]|nr:hypothetical protein GQ600_13559 [Phytophthora cactorum]